MLDFPYFLSPVNETARPATELTAAEKQGAVLQITPAIVQVRIHVPITTAFSTIA